ncbi:hypothetical protein [Carboxylicivirga marina]|uniref:Uncharacterized protein n=1 Tax=Carboxylicivirga marina TaxID=2800988 RepID=A0ABS1HIW9_9BACT|nr:hypothetical protein [Carboxylicivirga marina]MBK3517410.1 hypothetical protein [Carboxylicivirga marina]
MNSKLITILLGCTLSFNGCSADNTQKEEELKEPEVTSIIQELKGNKFIADYTVAKESVLRSIPEEYINSARENLCVAYQHTSHGTHVSRGLYGLPDYKAGDDALFGIVRNDFKTGVLDFLDYAIEDYAEDGRRAVDLSRDETAFIQATRNFLDDSKNEKVNVVMWAWCNIAGHDVEGNYLPGMQTLIDEYGVGGSKIGEGEGKRQQAVYFVFMTGHANRGSNTGEGNPAEQATLINDFCNKNKLLCLDYYSIDTHCMNDHYWEDAGDNGKSSSYGGNYYEDWQNSHQEGIDYYLNKSKPGGDVELGSHTTQHITSNRKAYAMWWILARISGWDGTLVN